MIPLNSQMVSILSVRIGLLTSNEFILIYLVALRLFQWSDWKPAFYIIFMFIFTRYFDIPVMLALLLFVTVRLKENRNS